jgi:hypothetical protein
MMLSSPNTLLQIDSKEKWVVENISPVDSHASWGTISKPTTHFMAMDDYPDFQSDPFSILPGDIDVRTPPRENWNNRGN